MALVSESDARGYGQILTSLDKCNKGDITRWRPERKLHSHAQRLAVLAAKVVKFDDSQNKLAASKNWFEQQAEAMDMELDDLVTEEAGNSDPKAAQNAKLAQKSRAELRSLLRVQIRRRESQFDL